jgi:hypothetical protein
MQAKAIKWRWDKSLTWHCINNNKCLHRLFKSSITKLTICPNKCEQFPLISTNCLLLLIPFSSQVMDHLWSSEKILAPKMIIFTMKWNKCIMETINSFCYQKNLKTLVTANILTSRLWSLWVAFKFINLREFPEIKLLENAKTEQPQQTSKNKRAHNV